MPTILLEPAGVNANNAPQKRALTWPRFAFWCFALFMGACQAWVSRNTVTTDGISYLDMSDAVTSGRWSLLVNGYWNPLYPVLLGVARAIVRPANLEEFAVLHLVNLAIFVCTLAAFEFLLRGLLSWRNQMQSKTHQALPEWFVAFAAYCVFAWASLGLIGVGTSSPDMAVAAFVFLAAGFIVRVVSGAGGWRDALAAGLSLGIGYLAKTPVFPLAFVFLGTLLLGGLRRGFPKLLMALAAFASVAACYMVPLSLNKHRLTFGDSGTLNYAWFVDGSTHRHWEGETLGAGSGPAPRWPVASDSAGMPVHPTRKLRQAPPLFEFNGPVPGTYPVWFDPSYWNEGLKARFNLRQQFRKLIINAKYVYGLFLNVHALQLFRSGRLTWLFSPLFLAALVFLFYQEARSGFVFRGLTGCYVLLAPAAAALGMYWLVYSEPRHIGPFAALLYLSLLLAVRLPKDASMQPSVRATGLLVVTAFVLTCGISALQTALVAARASAAPEEFQTATLLSNMGIAPGTKIASLEYSNYKNVKWARLLRARIVAEIYTGTVHPTETTFWAADPATQTSVLQQFASAGADVVVAAEAPASHALPTGWERVGSSGYSIYRLKELQHATLHRY